MIVVIHYPDGTKLGTSGLTVTYHSATAVAIEASQIEIKLVGETVTYTFAYPIVNQVMRIVKELQSRIASQTFDNTCDITLTIRQSKAGRLRNTLHKLSPE